MIIFVILIWVFRIFVLGDEVVWSGKIDLAVVCFGLVYVLWVSYNLSDIIRINMKFLNYCILNDNKIIYYSDVILYEF